MGTGPRRKVLLIDDEQDLVDALRLRLRSRPELDVRSCSDPEEGLTLAESWVPDAIVLDIAMPKLDGWEVCRRLRDDPRTRNVPVIIATAWVAPETEGKARDLGVTVVMTKPFDEELFVQAVVSAARPAVP